MNIDLSVEEAGFLLRQMNQPSMTGTLLSELLTNEDERRIFVSNNISFHQLPDLLKNISPSVKDLLKMARNFWSIMEGAHIRYNCLLQKSFGTKSLQDEFEEEWREWRRKMEGFQWVEWSEPTLWLLVEKSGHRVKDYTRTFVEQWCALLRQTAHPADLERHLDELVTKQERQNKKGRSRLSDTSRSDLSVKNWIGIRSLDYRFRQVHRIMLDLHKGVGRSA